MRAFGFELRRAEKAMQPPSPRAPRTAMSGYVGEPFAGAWQRGQEIEPIGGLTSFGAVYACVARISADIAKLELRLTMEGPGGTRIPVPSNSPFWEGLRTPNRYQNRIQWIQHWLASKLLRGSAYHLKERDARGVPYAFHPLDTRTVHPLVTPQGDVYYSLGGNDLAKSPGAVVVPASEIVHDRGPTLWHPLVGETPIAACALSATQGLRIQRNGLQFFSNMSRPSGALTAPGTIDDVTATRLKTEFERNYSAENIGRLAVLGDGLKYEPMTVPAGDAQLIEQLGWTVEDVARCFSMPLYKINAGAIPTAGNVEALETQYYTGCLQILIESIELCLTEGLGLGRGETAGYGVEFDLDKLLRMDGATRIDFLAKAVGGAIMKPDEARARANLPPVAGGDAVYLQQQNYSLAALARRDAREDPFAPSGSAPPAKAPIDSADDAEDMPAGEDSGDTAAEADAAKALADALVRAFEVAQ